MRVNNVEITVDYLKDKVHEQFLELQELRKSYDELTKSALQLNEMVKEKQGEIERLNQYIDFYKDITERQNKVMNLIYKCLKNIYKN